MLSRRFGSVLSIATAVSCLLSACQPAPTVAPTLEPTLAPSSTPLPTATPIPSPTPFPAAAIVAQGTADYRAGHYTQAEQAFRQVISADPSYAPAFAMLSRLEITQGDDEAALKSAQQAAELAPDSALAQAALSQAHLTRYAFADALKSAQKAVELDANNAYAQAMLSYGLLADRSYDQARAAAEKAVEVGPQDAEAWMALSFYYKNTADYSRQLATIEKARSLEPQFPAWQRALAEYWMTAEQFDRAEAPISATLQLNPDDPTSLALLTTLHLNRRDFAAAETYLTRLETLKPDQPDTWVLRGVYFVQTREFDKALEQYKKALDKHPQYWFARFMTGMTYIAKEECEQAARQFENLVADSPRLAMGQVGMGSAKVCAGDLTKALTYFRKAVEIEPYNAEAHMAQAIVYAAQQRPDESAAAMSKAAQYSPRSSRIHTLFVTTQASLPHQKAEYRKALELNGRNADAHRGLADVLLREARQSEAEEHARTALELDPNNNANKLMLGAALAQQHKLTEAEKWLREVLDEKPEELLANYHLGVVLLERRSYSEARKFFETYQKLIPPQQQTSASDTQTKTPVQELIAILSTGYPLDADEAIAGALKQLDFFKNGVRFSVENVPYAGSTLVAVITTPVKANEVELVVGIVAAVASKFALRVQPELSGGLIVRLQSGRTTLATVEATREVMWRFAVGQDTIQQMFSRLKFTRGDGAPPMATVTQLQTDMAALRELKAMTKVPFEYITTEQVAERASASIDEEYRESILIDQHILTLLGIISPTTDLAALTNSLWVSQIAGFYTPKDKKFYIVNDGEQGANTQMTFAHEYVHALQDQHYDLTQLDAKCGNDDACDALRAVIEGDATLAMIFYANKYMPIVDVMQARDSAAGVDAAASEKAPSFLSEAAMFSYANGLEFVYTIYQRGEWNAVNKLFANLPQSTEQILHPELYLENHAPVKASMPDLPASLKEGWKVVEDNVMGELSWRLLLAQTIGPGAAAVAAKGWGGDRYVLLQQGDSDHYVFVARTYWDTQSDADEFHGITQMWLRYRDGFSEEVQQLVGSVNGHLWVSDYSIVHTQQKDRYVTLVIGTDLATVKQVAELAGK